MQKKMIALAIAAAFAAPVAMAGVDMYGSMDGGLRHQINPTAAAGTTDTMQMGQWNTARFGFKGTDDLGDGMKATVVLETSLAPAGVGSNPIITSGATATAQATMNQGSNPFGLLFDRQATIGIAGGFGAIDMGWNYATAFKVITTYDPLKGKLLALTSVNKMNNGLRRGNLVYTGSFGDVKVMAEYDVPNADKANQPQVGAGRAVGVTYAAGDINAGAAYSAEEPAVGAGDTPTTHMTVGAGYKMGDMKLNAGYAKQAQKQVGSGDKTDTTMFLGLGYDMSAKVNVTAAYYSNATNTGVSGADDVTKKTMIVAATYAMSKATTAYFEVDRATSNAGGGADDAITSGLAFGINTSF